MAKLVYLPFHTDDYEERIEEEAMRKAMHNEYGDDITSTATENLIQFGRVTKNNPVSDNLEYWLDPAFEKYAKRSFVLANFEELNKIFQKWHSDGIDLFIKSTRLKHFIANAPIGTNVYDVFGYLAFSFIDGGPKLIVQEHVKMQYEYRFIVIDREIITASPNAEHLTPLDFPLKPDTLFETPKSKNPVYHQDIVDSLYDMATKMAKEMLYPHAVVDCAIINGSAGVVELNPLQIGKFGLFAIDVDAIARASRKLLPEGTL